MNYLINKWVENEYGVARIFDIENNVIADLIFVRSKGYASLKIGDKNHIIFNTDKEYIFKSASEILKQHGYEFLTQNEENFI